MRISDWSSDVCSSDLSDKMILQAVQTDLRAFLKPVAAAYDSLAQSKEISFDFEMEENISLYLDPEKMEKILHNILSNAFKFTEKVARTSITPGVLVSKRTKRARIIKTNTGFGISPNYLISERPQFESH